MSRVRVHQRAVRALEGNPDVRNALSRIGDQVADRAAQSAPKDTGAGAASIRAEIAGGGVRVSWDRDHFYMGFVELGTSTQAARPFLRPALDAHFTL